jgi:hypothetical protein
MDRIHPVFLFLSKKCRAISSFTLFSQPFHPFPHSMTIAVLNTSFSVNLNNSLKKFL